MLALVYFTGFTGILLFSIIWSNTPKVLVPKCPNSSTLPFLVGVKLVTFIICRSPRLGHIKHLITILSITHDIPSWKNETCSRKLGK